MFWFFVDQKYNAETRDPIIPDLYLLFLDVEFFLSILMNIFWFMFLMKIPLFIVLENVVWLLRLRDQYIKKIPLFDQILRKVVAKWVSNNLFIGLIAVVVAFKDTVYIFLSWIVFKILPKHKPTIYFNNGKQFCGKTPV
jgi:type II secretory pathway component PulF